jgi:hypothetical protein
MSWLDLHFRKSDQQDAYGEADRLITDWLTRNKEFERHIFAHIAGVTFPNSDGNYRQALLCRCKPLDRLILKWEPDNPVSRTAIAVYLETGEQLGYLDSRLGKDTFKRIKKGEHWIGFIVSVGVATASKHEVLGATIVIVKLRNSTSTASG